MQQPFADIIFNFPDQFVTTELLAVRQRSATFDKTYSRVFAQFDTREYKSFLDHYKILDKDVLNIVTHNSYFGYRITKCAFKCGNKYLYTYHDNKDGYHGIHVNKSLYEVYCDMRTNPNTFLDEQSFYETLRINILGS